MRFPRSALLLLMMAIGLAGCVADQQQRPPSSPSGYDRPPPGYGGQLPLTDY
jgi:hypothetical protein